MTQYDRVCHMRAMQICFRNCIWITWSISLTNWLHSCAAISPVLRPAISQTNPIKKKRAATCMSTYKCMLFGSLVKHMRDIRRHPKASGRQLRSIREVYVRHQGPVFGGQHPRTALSNRYDWCIGWRCSHNFLTLMVETQIVNIFCWHNLLTYGREVVLIYLLTEILLTQWIDTIIVDSEVADMIWSLSFLT